MASMRRYDAIIFDFDGLVIDTESPAFEAWSAIFQEQGTTLLLERWVECVGASDSRFDPVLHLSELTGRTYDRATLMGDKEKRKAEICNTLLPLPGVIDRMNEARHLGLKIAVASSSSRVWVETHLMRLGLRDQLDAMLTRDDVSRGKPFPDLYFAAAKAIGVPPERCLAFEDSGNGVRAAKAAGMACYAIPNPITRTLDFRMADGVIASLAEVTVAKLVGAV